MRIDSRVNDMSFKTAQIQNRNFKKTVDEAENIKKHDVTQKTTENHLKTSESKAERKDVINSEVKTNEQFKTYSKGGKVTEGKVQEVSKLDVRV